MLSETGERELLRCGLKVDQEISWGCVVDCLFLIELRCNSRTSGVPVCFRQDWHLRNAQGHSASPFEKSASALRIIAPGNQTPKQFWMFWM